MYQSLQAAYAELAESRTELARQAGEIDAARELFEQVIDSMSEALLLLDTRGRIMRVNAAAVALLGRDDEELVGKLLDATWHEPRVPTTPSALLARAPDGVLSDIGVEVRREGRSSVPVSVACTLVRSNLGCITGLLVVAHDITERKQAETTLSFLADASRALAESLDFETTLKSVARVAVPSLADWCIVYALEEDGSIRRVTIAHADPSLASLADAIERGFHIDPAARGGVAGVIRNGRAELRPHVDPAVLAADVREPERLEPLLEQVGPVSWICVPLEARTRTLGAISFVTAESRRRYEEADLAKAKEIAHRAAVALDNARLYELERDVAETLQRSLLPRQLPELPGIALAARYIPARPQAVGGDWYDVFELPDGKVGLVMGDVAGRGVPAAAAMGQLRTALRAYALDGHSPSDVAQRLNSVIEDEMATLAYAVLDPVAWTMTSVNAGHPPPLVIAPDGSTGFLEGGSLPIASVVTPVYGERTVAFEPGSTVLLYTDGLVEVRGETLDEGLARLEDAAQAVAGARLDDMLDAILERVRQGPGATDDAALLAMRASALDLEGFALRRRAVPSALPGMRRDLRRWLVAAGAGDEELNDILIACSEACANAVEHAYGAAGGDVALEASRRSGEIVITVSDEGEWRPARGINRGHGSSLMNALMHEVSVDHGPGGTTVVMKRRIDAAART